MVDPEGTDASEGADAGGGVLGFLTTTQKLIAGFSGLIVATSSLLIALNKVGLIGGGDEENGTAAPTTIQTETAPKGPRGVFAELTRPIGRVYFDGEAMYVKAAQPGRPLVHVADREEPLQDVALSARISWVSGARDYGMGFVCRYESSGSYYLVSVLSGGRYHIVRYRRGRPVSLTRGIQRSNLVAGDAVEVTARCVGENPTSVTLDANGRRIASATDADGIKSGNVGIRVGSAEAWVTAKFDGFELRYL